VNGTLISVYINGSLILSGISTIATGNQIGFEDGIFGGDSTSLNYIKVTEAIPPVIVTEPGIEAVVTGATATFSVVNSNALAPTYQWQVSTDGGGTWNSVSGTPYSGGTTGTLTITSPTAALLGYQYEVVISNPLGSTISAPAPLVVGTSSAKLAWLQNNFTTAQLGNPSLISDMATPANDGIPNLIKYAFNLNPLLDGHPFLPQPTVSAGNLTLTFPAPQADLIYTVQASLDLLNWGTTGVIQTNDPTNGTITAAYPISPSTPAFLRILVSEAP
jgi:hypothetical protein